MENHEHDLARAICGAYMAVAFADARFVDIEERRFLGSLAGETDEVSAAALSSAYNGVITAYERDYAAALDETRVAIARARAGGASIAPIVKAARLAIVADRAVAPQEEHVLSLLAEALGMAKGEL